MNHDQLVMVITEKERGDKMEQQERAAGKTQGTNPRFFFPYLSFTHYYVFSPKKLTKHHPGEVTKQNEEGGGYKERREALSFHLEASEVEHGGPEPEEVAALAVGALGEPQAAAEAEPGLPLHRLHHHHGGLLLARRRRADAEVQVEVGALERLPLAPDAGGVVLMMAADRRRFVVLLQPEDGALILLTVTVGGRCRRLERYGYVGRVLVDGAVGHRVDPPAQQLPPDVRVPVVLDLVVRPARQPSSDQGPSVPYRTDTQFSK